MKRTVAFAAAVALIPIVACADEQASVLVTTTKVRQGSVPEKITSFGTVAPTSDGTMTLSLLRAGQVLDVDVSSGEAVRKGERLLGFSADPAVVLAWNQAVSALELARQQQARSAELLAQQLATKAQFAEATKAVSDAEAALEAQRRVGGDQQISSLTAPFDGIVTVITVAPGERTQAGAPLLSLARADGLAVIAGVEPAERAKLHPDETVDLEPLDGSGAALSGTVRSVGAMLDAKTRLINVVVAVAPESIFPGEIFRARIVVGEQRGWLAPRQAVLSDERGSYVFQVADGKASRVSVRAVAADGDEMALDGPLDPRRPLVITGNYQLADGTSVREATATP